LDGATEGHSHHGFNRKSAQKKPRHMAGVLSLELTSEGLLLIVVDLLELGVHHVIVS
jgi:hypothetical protein